MSAEQQTIALKQEAFIEAFENSPFYFPNFKCPLSRCLMSDPVMLSNGRSYNRDSATTLLETDPRCPETRELLNPSFMIDNISLKGAIRSAMERFKKSAEGAEYANFNYDPTVKFIYENRVPNGSRGPIPPPLLASSSSSDSFLDSNCGKLSVSACSMGAGAPATAITTRVVGAHLLPCSCSCCLGTTVAGITALAVSTAIGVLGIFAVKKGYEALCNEPSAVVVPVAASMEEEVAIAPAAMPMEEGKEEDDRLQAQHFISYGSMRR